MGHVIDFVPHRNSLHDQRPWQETMELGQDTNHHTFATIVATMEDNNWSNLSLRDLKTTLREEVAKQSFYLDTRSNKLQFKTLQEHI